MEHFYHNIHGWFSARDLYSDMVAQGKDGDIFVEVGAWKGQSASFMAVEIINSGKQISFHVVDHFKGSDEAAHHDDADVREGRLLDVFKENLAPVIDRVKIHVAGSVEAASHFADGSLAFVYIDAGHDYDSVKADIEAWLPKVRSGGTIGGDDIHGAWPGVERAVREVFSEPKIHGVTWTWTKP